MRATLILIPLLGLHYMLTPFRPEQKSKWEQIYEIVAALCTSFQGLCVAMLFCFCNAEVIAVIRKKLKDTCSFSASSSRAGYLAGFVQARLSRFEKPSKRAQISAGVPKQPHQHQNVANGTSGTKGSNCSSLMTTLAASPVHSQTQPAAEQQQQQQQLSTTGGGQEERVNLLSGSAAQSPLVERTSFSLA